MNILRLLILVLLILGLAPSGLPSQEVLAEDQPAWILYEMGKAELESKDKKDLGEAVNIFRQAIEKAGIYPEAEVALGDIYFIEGEFVLAEKQYKKAYEFRKSFISPDEQYALLYKMAELYKNRKYYMAMEDHLLRILKDQPYFNDDDYSQFRASFQDIYVKKGLDHLFKLYRIEGAVFSTKAHAELGWFYYLSGRFIPSILHSLFALNILISNAVTELRRFDPQYEYAELKIFVDRALSRSNIREYFSRSNFFRILYYLAVSNYAAGRPGHATEIWSFLVSTDHAGQYNNLARRQLRAPWIEPRINH